MEFPNCSEQNAIYYTSMDTLEDRTEQAGNDTHLMLSFLDNQVPIWPPLSVDPAMMNNSLSYTYQLPTHPAAMPAPAYDESWVLEQQLQQCQPSSWPSGPIPTSFPTNNRNNPFQPSVLQQDLNTSNPTPHISNGESALRQSSTQTGDGAREYSLPDGTRLYKCDWAGCPSTVSFRDRNSLRRHVRSIHTHPTAYRCGLDGCQWAFGRKDHLEEHRRRRHGLWRGNARGA
ncbi:hypothetical protein BJY00DRAFT_311236 [Aspergillus carlsbadensis]|nr:hypothetical protein BJY00DRAFT_311236 [Aspergillus carlsbadensis]